MYNAYKPHFVIKEAAVQSEHNPLTNIKKKHVM